MNEVNVQTTTVEFHHDDPRCTVADTAMGDLAFIDTLLLCGSSRTAVVVGNDSPPCSGHPLVLLY